MIATNPARQQERRPSPGGASRSPRSGHGHPRKVCEHTGGIATPASGAGGTSRSFRPVSGMDGSRRPNQMPVERRTPTGWHSGTPPVATPRQHAHRPPTRCHRNRCEQVHRHAGGAWPCPKVPPAHNSPAPGRVAGRIGSQGLTARPRAPSPCASLRPTLGMSKPTPPPARPVWVRSFALGCYVLPGVACFGCARALLPSSATFLQVRTGAQPVPVCCRCRRLPVFTRCPRA